MANMQSLLGEFKSPELTRFLHNRPENELALEMDRVTQNARDQLALTEHVTQSAREQSALSDTFRKYIESDARLYDPASNGLTVSAMLHENMPSKETLSTFFGAIQDPWVRADNPAASMLGLAKLSAIGSSLDSQPPYSQGLSETLRSVLGDWRNSDGLIGSCNFDSFPKHDYYVSHGLDNDITDFPADRYRDILSMTGVFSHEPTNNKPPQQADGNTKREGTPSGQNDNILIEAQGFTNDRAILVVRDLEKALRIFISKMMSTAFGNKWVKQRVGGKTYKTWKFRKEESVRHGLSPKNDILEYSDLNDLLDIIIRNDNWDAIFKQFFFNKGSIIESFNRIYPARCSLDHARELENDELLYLFVEVRRINKAIEN